MVSIAVQFYGSAIRSHFSAHLTKHIEFFYGGIMIFKMGVYVDEKGVFYVKDRTVILKSNLQRSKEREWFSLEPAQV